LVTLHTQNSQSVPIKMWEPEPAVLNSWWNLIIARMYKYESLKTYRPINIVKAEDLHESPSVTKYTLKK